MMVTIQNNGPSITGIRFNLADVRRHFPRNLESVEIELNDLHIRCELHARFWLDQPEITDPRLCSWIEEQLFELNLRGASVPLQMVRRANVYTLHLVPTRQQAGRIGFGLCV